MKKKGKKGVLDVARDELTTEKKEKIVIYFLLATTVLSVSALLFLLSSSLISTGNVSVASNAGTISEINLTRSIATLYWHGIYGLALSVNNFSEQLSDSLDSGSVTRQDLFFSCIQQGAVGGNEVYASTSPSIDFNNLHPANISLIDNFTGCNVATFDPNLGYNHVDCANNTFTGTMWDLVGSENITGIPSTHTYSSDGTDVFDIGALTDGTHLVFVTHIVPIQRGFDPAKTVNYQMLLPTNPDNATTYYFFTDPNDNCPTGALGQTINSTLYGYVTSTTNGNPIYNATVSVLGHTAQTDSQGYYNISFLSGVETHNVLALANGFDPTFTNITINSSHYNFELNLTLSPATPGLNQTVNPTISGYVRDNTTGDLLQSVIVYVGNSRAITDANGHYSISPVLPAGSNPLAAIKPEYENYYTSLNFTNDSAISYNFTMTPLPLNYPYQTGPYTQPPQPIQKNAQDYWISTKDINVQVRKDTFIDQTISLYNFKGSPMTVIFSIPDSAKDYLKLSQTSVVMGPSSFGSVVLTIYGTRPLGNYNSTISLSGDITSQIPVEVKVVDKNFPVETLLAQLQPFQSVVNPGGNLTYRLNLQNLLRDQSYQLAITTSVRDKEGNVVATKSLQREISNSLTLVSDIKIPDNATVGDYTLDVGISYLGSFTGVTAPFKVAKPLYLYAVFGIPLWIYFVIVSSISFIFLNVFLYKVYKKKKARYGIQMDYNTLPKPGRRVVKLGLIAETKKPAYYEIDKLTVHAIVAGATGMGKSISAQVLIEECLLNNVAVIVFDPTAQWSGMLRKCTDKKMLAYYPKFGLKEGDARAFKGNVREIKDSREYIDVKKYMNPGEIQIFSLNKLQPKDIDIFVANVIRGIFKSDPKEAPDLKLLLVFDEVHRLLSKFGGSGQGFLQVERACREFRKWGMGVMLISQVLADFVGEIKANINTELQTRTVEEGDLNRIKTKYGEEYLKSLVRAEIGVIMFQNAEYNRGKPYFINFRPILHNTRRLSDQELDKYNQYNNMLDDIEYQIEQLEKLKIDTFDFKMELKLMKDKLMSGNFSVVEIYLEGLKPRIAKEWQKLGRTPLKRQLQLVSEEEIQKSIAEAQKARSSFEKEEAAKAAKEAANKKPEEKKEDLDNKIVNPLTFDNGAMVSSLKELKDFLPSLPDDVFAIHVNAQKNDIGKWIADNFQDNSINAIRTKPEMIKAVQQVGKAKAAPPAQGKAPAQAAGKPATNATQAKPQPAKK